MSDGGRSDASTSTDDVKARPLCLFYFSQPFGVLSPEPPTLAAAPPHVARAFLDMQPVSPFYWPPAAAAAAGRPADTFRSAASGSSFELGAATVHAAPVLRVRCPQLRRDSLCSSLFSSELWLESSASSRAEPPRRVLPYTRTLPPLRLPSARALSDRSEDEVWPRKCLHPEKFSLPPISLPARGPSACSGASSAREPRAKPRSRRTPRTGAGVDKARRRRRAAADVRRVLACLVRRAVAAGSEQCSPSPALARVLATIRAAWTEPPALTRTCGVPCPAAPRPPGDMPFPAPAPAPHASPGLLRRRYSVPETIMRKYRLAQLSDSDESAAAAAPSAASACASPRDVSLGDSPHRFLRRDRELMRKSALLRRMAARPCRVPACRCEEARASRSLEGSRSELWARRSPAPPAPAAAPLSASTFRSHGGRAPSSRPDSCSDSESRPPPSSDRVTAELESQECSPSATHTQGSSGGTEPLSSTQDASESTAAPRDSTSSGDRIEGRVSECSAADNDERNLRLYSRPLAAAAPPLMELLEIVVSESADASSEPARRTSLTPRPALLAPRLAQDIDIDEYVSNILVESLNSLSDQLDGMSAVIGDRRINVVEKEIKVRLQNTAVNTIVHLSPTSNNQIIFGNEELCSEPSAERDQCNNPLPTLAIRDERELSAETNNNLSSSAASAPPTPAAPEPAPAAPRDAVNRAVLNQIQRLFHDELRGLQAGEPPPGAGVSRVDISSVDAYMEAHGAPSLQLEITRADPDLIAGVGAGNYFRAGEPAAAVPRRSAYPHSASMEVNTSSSSEGEAAAACSDCTSLVDSLDDPGSPRGMLLRRAGRDLLRLRPHPPARSSAECRAEAFFVRIEDDDHSCDRGNVTVAEYMPEKIKQKLHRRHRKRELRMECARRSKVKQLKKELERRRLEEAALARRELEQDCVAIVNALIDDVVARIAQDEYDCMRNRRRAGAPPAARCEESHARRVRRRDRIAPEEPARRVGPRRSGDDAQHHVRGKLVTRPSIPHPDRPPRRIYQKSEIHEGENCIEILEILEYVNGSQSSPETTNSDENHSSRSRKSRIPVPVYERIQRTRRSDARPPAEEEHELAGAMLRALGEPSAPHEPSETGAPPEPRSRSNSLRFRRVFDIIPEERSFDLSEDAEHARRASAPEVAVPPPSAPAPAPAPAPATRCAGTSPPEERVRALRSQTTMTSPCSKSAATSPLRPAAPPRPTPPRPAPPRPAREGIVCALRPPALHRPASLAVE